MKKQTVTTVLIITIVMQLTVLAIEFAGAFYPLVSGKEIKLKVIPIDPRDIFRGNYARLNYDIGRVESPIPAGGRKLRMGEVIYVKLKQGQDGLYVEDGTSLDKPTSGLFMRARVDDRYPYTIVRVRYGIEAFFAPKAKAQAMEAMLRKGGVAVVMVTEGGKAALKDVLPPMHQEEAPAAQ